MIRRVLGLKLEDYSVYSLRESSPYGTSLFLIIEVRQSAGQMVALHFFEIRVVPHELIHACNFRSSVVDWDTNFYKGETVLSRLPQPKANNTRV